MNRLLIFLVVMLLIIVGALYLTFMLNFDAESDAKEDVTVKSIEELGHVVQYMDPEKYMRSPKRRYLESTPAGTGVVLIPKESGSAKEPEFVRQAGYVGPESCRECHADMYDSFIETAHYKTSSLPSSDSLLGAFQEDKDAVTTKVRGFSYDVILDNEDYFQVVKVARKDEIYEHRQRIDIITGSGNHGQTHLYWKDDRLYELPVSWFRASGWVNSPGYKDGFANLARPIQPGCIACHATLFEEDQTSVNRFDKESFILGVTCEKCHGPGKEHVDYHQKNPTDKESKFIAHPGKLPREQANDVCGQCHTGRSKLKKSMFGFRPGDNIHDFKEFPKPNGSTGNGGVHSANQHPRLLQSRCYQETDSMSCVTCHNPHQQEHANVKLFSKRCMKCHEIQDCGQFEHSGQRIASNCIDCHMPKRKDETTKMSVSDTLVFPEIRDHYIRVQKDATKLVLDSWAAEDAKELDNANSIDEQDVDGEKSETDPEVSN